MIRRHPRVFGALALAAASSLGAAACGDNNPATDDGSDVDDPDANNDVDIDAGPDDPDAAIDVCDPNPCQNGGTCSDDGGAASCECPDGFTGNHCEIDVDLCADEPCANGGICSEVGQGISCECVGGFLGETCQIDPDLRLTVPSRMIADKTLTLRAEILDEVSGNIVLDGCFDDLGTVSLATAGGADVPITITFFDDHLPTPADSIRFYHGVGSVSFTLDDGAAVPAGDYVVTVTIGARTASKRVTIENAPTWRVMPASLSGADLVWGPNENIRISEHWTEVPFGETLTILPGTLVMVDSIGALEDGTMINVYGKLQAAGDVENPIHIFSTEGPAAMIHTVEGSLSNIDAWRGISLWGSETSTMDWLILTGAGNGPIISHPRPPVISAFDNANFTIQDSVFVDSTGMMFQTPSPGNFVIRRSLVSRTGIGAEFLSSGNTTLIEDSWFTGIGRGPTEPVRFDGDGIHLDGFGSTQTVRRTIVADIGDDAIDHSNSNFTIQDAIIHDSADKGVSMTAGQADFHNLLMFNTGSGIRGTANVERSTIASGAPLATPLRVVDSIFYPSSIGTCFAGADIDYTLVGNGGDLGCGDGNLSVDPLFSSPGTCDFSLQAGSPAATAGQAGGEIGFAGFTVAPAPL